MIMSDEIQTVSPKGQSLVGYCSYCGVEFEERQKTNQWLKCPVCDSIQMVRIKTELDPTDEE